MITIKATDDTTLHTAGKYCEEDILVQVPEGSAALPDLFNEGASTDLLLGKELIDSNVWTLTSYPTGWELQEIVMACIEEALKNQNN